MQVINQIEKTRKILVPLYDQFSDIQKVILFGSRARGDEEERSDIDVARRRILSKEEYDESFKVVHEKQVR